MIKWIRQKLGRARRFVTLKRIAIIVIAGGLVWGAGLAVLARAVHQRGQDDDARPADVIIVLGSGLRRDGRPGDALLRRSIWAADLYAAGVAPEVICTGGVGAGQRRSEASACGEVLRSRGVPGEAIHLDELSKSTEENAINARDIMDAQGFEDAVLVTDSFHMFRASWIFDQQDVEHARSPAPREWVRDYYYDRHFAREIVALHWQAFKTAFNLPLTNIG